MQRNRVYAEEVYRKKETRDQRAQTDPEARVDLVLVPLDPEA